MPVCLRNSANHGSFRRDECLEIGVINNMPDGALRMTERQCVTLLDSASEGSLVRVSFYALPEVPRGDACRRHIRAGYCDVDTLWNQALDGVIVTGAEPRTSDLKDEAYWGSLTNVIEWAEHNTHSAVWSCLAAHAAVLHLDGISRRKLSDKRFGLFECSDVCGHGLTAGFPSRFVMPHSRWNDVAEGDLLSGGYTVLTRSADAGVDAFLRQQKSLFLFFQGHPEYEADTLLLEYRRDIGRYLKRARETYPPMPKGYFEGGAAGVLTAFQERAMGDRREELLEEFPIAAAEESLASTWRPAAARVYRNWLGYLRAQKESLKRIRRRPDFATKRGLTPPRRFAAGA